MIPGYRIVPASLVDDTRHAANPRAPAWQVNQPPRSDGFHDERSLRRHRRPRSRFCGRRHADSSGEVSRNGSRRRRRRDRRECRRDRRAPWGARLLATRLGNDGTGNVIIEELGRRGRLLADPPVRGPALADLGDPGGRPGRAPRDLVLGSGSSERADMAADPSCRAASTPSWAIRAGRRAPPICSAWRGKRAPPCWTATASRPWPKPHPRPPMWRSACRAWPK